MNYKNVRSACIPMDLRRKSDLRLYLTGIDESSLRDKRNAVGLVRIVSAVELITEPILDESKPVESYNQKSDRVSLAYKAGTPTNLQVLVSSCTFLDIRGYSNFGGSAICIDNHRADVVVMESSFKRCPSASSGSNAGAVFVGQNPNSVTDSKFYLTLFKCRFSNNTAKNGGHVYVQYYHPLTVAQCRVESIDEPVLNAMIATVTVVVKGVKFPSSITNVSVEHQTSLVSSKSVFWNSKSQLTVSFGAGQFQSTSTLAFGEQYEITSVSAGSTVYVTPSLVFSIASLIRTASASLNLSDFDEVFISLTAFGFPSSTPIMLTIVEVDGDDTHTGSPFTLTETPSDTEDTTLILTTRVDTNKLQHTKRYEITQCDVTNRKTVRDGRVFFRVPARPILTGVAFSFATMSNTTFNLILEGTDLPVGETFVASLDGFDDTIEVTFTTTSGGSSAELALGWSDTFQFDTAYPLRSVIHKGESSFSFPFTGLTLQTKPRPNPLIVFATDSANSDPKFCGVVDRPCSSVDVAWLIVDAFSAQRVSLVLIKKALLASQMVIESGQEVIVQQDLLPPTLVIPSTASLGDSAGLVSILGTLLLEKVNIDVQIAALSFVLFDVKSGKLVMDSVHISGVTSSSDVVDGIEGLCSWETGLIKLHESNCTLTSCVLSSIGMGEIWMESSNLSLISTQILSNGARFSLFPSAQQDVMCKSGNITILPSSSDTSEDRWISSTSDCSVVLNGSELKSPHFVPSLDVKNSKSTLSKKKDSFSVSIVGSKLIPCDLKLEVSESSSSSQSLKSNAEPVVIDLSFSSVESWNETDITLSIASSSLSNLSWEMEWTARIVFGNGEHTASFTFLESLKNRKAEALKESLPWLIPVIVCSVLLLLAILIVVIILVWRRKKQTASSNTKQTIVEQELVAEDVMKMDVQGTMNLSTKNVIGEKSDQDGRFGLIQNDHPLTIEHGNSTAKEGSKMETQVAAMKCQDDFGIVHMNDADTLYNKLHKEHTALGGKKNLVERQIVMGLLKITEQNSFVNVAARISSHWIILDTKTSVLFKVDSPHSHLDENATNAASVSTTSSHPNNRHLKDGVEEIRWRAPEQGEKEGEMINEVDKVKASVFRLGLIFWEVETGLVPFGEIDAVNAHRQLAAGIALPLQKVTDSSMRDLIVECLRVDPDERPKLSDILSRLDTNPNPLLKPEMKDPFS
ncbi:hypothetical protein BLNAU_13562 [Blattamonas nauphoetae]|uniref:Protein kinase domain-containing protein n=1 Tax=Blattamonas nauphoetae TaxID=2049346 RepID=A0ABQ9XK09_9EUKA|nr:hypothetical protein BLNAU_13562 [Blattamonas nauphoetae]